MEHEIYSMSKMRCKQFYQIKL